MLLFAPQARGRVPGKTGVWVGERKIGAVGVRITHGISSHGIALNVTTDLAAYKHIVPCGTPDKEVTSVLQELRWPGSGLKKVHGSVDCSTVGPAAGMHATCTGVKQGVAAQGGALPEQQQQQLEKEGQYKQQALLLRAAEDCLVAAIAGSLALDPVEAQLS
jgi:lipoyl(octanoyl) transferase